ncbi:acyl carrier protein [Paenarthrobacter sp. NPDC089322]|uniref:acyl carrier protein n=1 Tax=Paenarthrobacter sp. NPDC089322 TaxID=3155065 RepID=UPI00342906FA
MEITAQDVVEAIGSTMDELNHMGPDDSFADLDIDSLSLVEAAVILSNKFGVRVDEFELAEAGTASAAATVVTRKLALQPAG